MFLKNKYTILYFRLIDFSRSAHFNFIEKHHIIPKSLGGNNSPENIVKTSPRIHFILHKLLTKMFALPNKKMKMNYALWRMMNPQNKNHQRLYKVNAKTYESMKLLIKNQMSKNNPMKCRHRRERLSKNNPMHRPEVKAMFSGKNSHMHRPEVKAKFSHPRPEQSIVCANRNRIYWQNENNFIRKRNNDIKLAKERNVCFVVIDTRNNLIVDKFFLITDVMRKYDLSRMQVQYSISKGKIYDSIKIMKAPFQEPS
jgi:hypothetical protein